MRDDFPLTGPAAEVRAHLLALAQEPSPRPVAGGIVVNRAGQVALIYSTYANQGWHFPRGGLDEGETSLQGAIRETHEEAGVEVGPVDVPNLDLGGGGTFVEPLGFGSPRWPGTFVPRTSCDYFGEVIAVRVSAGHDSEVISQAALDLLRRAAGLAGMPDEEFLARRYELFDACREMPVWWQQRAVYHVLAFRRRTPERLNGESEKVRWWSLDELAGAIERRLERTHRTLGLLLPQLPAAVEAARQQAEDDG